MRAGGGEGGRGEKNWVKIGRREKTNFYVPFLEGGGRQGAGGGGQGVEGGEAHPTPPHPPTPVNSSLVILYKIKKKKRLPFEPIPDFRESWQSINVCFIG